jgi:hypothetical protein
LHNERTIRFSIVVYASGHPSIGTIEEIKFFRSRSTKVGPNNARAVFKNHHL